MAVIESTPQHKTTLLEPECPICQEAPSDICTCHSKDQGRCSLCRRIYDGRRHDAWRAEMENEQFESLLDVHEIQEIQETRESAYHGWTEWDAWEFIDFLVSKISVLVPDYGGGAPLKDLVPLIPAYCRYLNTDPNSTPPPTLPGAKAVDMLAHWCQRVVTGASLQETVKAGGWEDYAFDAMNLWVAVTDNKNIGHYPKRTRDVLMGHRLDMAGMEMFLKWERQGTRHGSTRSSNHSTRSELSYHIQWERELRMPRFPPAHDFLREPPLPSYRGWIYNLAWELIDFTVMVECLVPDPGGGARLKDLVPLIPAFCRLIVTPDGLSQPPTLAGAEAVDMLAHYCRRVVTGASPKQGEYCEDGYEAMKSWIYETDNKQTGHYPKRTRNILMGWKVDTAAVEKQLEEERRKILRERNRAQR
ncbi:hypothetical protein HDU88_008739 [Geranomyces variabilis]|nr:hypothetical protein HDU88_008739 [Geranomyces variabilis]